MRDQLNSQSTMPHYFTSGARVPMDHLLRGVNVLTDRSLGAIPLEIIEVQLDNYLGDDGIARFENHCDRRQV